MACSCGKGSCKGHCEFIAPMSALWQVYDGIGAKADVVAIAWEREDGKVFRYDLPIPKRLDPQAAKFVSHVVERIAKFIERQGLKLNTPEGKEITPYRYPSSTSMDLSFLYAVWD